MARRDLRSLRAQASRFPARPRPRRCGLSHPFGTGTWPSVQSKYREPRRSVAGLLARRPIAPHVATGQARIHFRPTKGGRVRQIETDYLVVGAGATGMAFVDTLVA